MWHEILKNQKLTCQRRRTNKKTKKKKVSKKKQKKQIVLQRLTGSHTQESRKNPKLETWYISKGPVGIEE